jgi:hypothetical protein
MKNTVFYQCSWFLECDGLLPDNATRNINACSSHPSANTLRKNTSHFIFTIGKTRPIVYPDQGAIAPLWHT